MNYHQSLKSEVEARSRSVLDCIDVGKTLLAARNPAAEEVRPSLQGFVAVDAKQFTADSFQDVSLLMDTRGVRSLAWIRYNTPKISCTLLL